MCTLCAPRALNKSRAARSEIALGGAGEVKRSPRSSPAPGASGLSLAEGGPRDAAWAAGSGAMDFMRWPWTGGSDPSAQRTPRDLCAVRIPIS